MLCVEPDPLPHLSVEAQTVFINATLFGKGVFTVVISLRWGQ